MQDDLQNLAPSDGVSVHSGFPNPALEHRGSGPLTLDLNKLLIRRPPSTHMFRVSGHAWADQGIYDGDIAVVDRAPMARPTDMLIAWRNADPVIVKQHQLQPEDKPWGVIMSVIHLYRP
jgi:SOS-response transcriptional repressor LexA